MNCTFQITKSEWAIGTTPGGTDIQGFVSVGLSTSAKNKDLQEVLHDNTTYYATVRVYNGAGLRTEKVSAGVFKLS